MTITAERPAPASLDIEQLREHRRALDIEIAHVATEWSKAWYDYVPQCPWAAVNERVMATHAFATRYHQLRAKRDRLEC